MTEEVQIDDLAAPKQGVIEEEVKNAAAGDSNHANKDEDTVAAGEAERNIDQIKGGAAAGE